MITLCQRRKQFIWLLYRHNLSEAIALPPQRDKQVHAAALSPAASKFCCLRRLKWYHWLHLCVRYIPRFVYRALPFAFCALLANCSREKGPIRLSSAIQNSQDTGVNCAETRRRGISVCEYLPPPSQETLYIRAQRGSRTRRKQTG